MSDAQRRAVEARGSCKDRAQRGCARHSTSLRRSSRRQTLPTDHNQLTMEVMQQGCEEARACLPAARKALCRASTAAASTTTGRSRPTPASTCLSRAKRRTKTRSSCCSCVPLSRRSTNIRICSAFRWHPPDNDHRLGANEAPPAIVSMFLGDELERHS